MLVRRFRLGRPQRVRVRKSHWGWFPHFLYEEARRGRTRVWSYVPIDPARRLCPPLLFRGRVRWGDG
jgi:hypothetical protein